MNEEVVRLLILEQVERPKGLWGVRVSNVFDNRYRINMWVEIDEDGVTKRKIGASYFAILDGGQLRLVNV